MQFIRSEKLKADYDSQTSHCLYGLDADLIMLGLSSHEPYFTIVREKVLFKSRRRQETDALFNTKDISFQRTDEYQFFSLYLLREYLQLEFSVFNPQATERLIGK